MLHAKVTGSGLPVVFIHGYSEDLSLWDDISSHLSKKYKVISLDLPGFGKSKPTKAPFSLKEIATIVHNYITKNLKIEQYLVFGHSLGGYISLQLANSYPQSILAFGLINSTSFADTSEKKANRTKTIDFINKHGSKFFLQSFVPNLFAPDNQSKFANEISEVLEMGARLPNSVLTSYMQAMRDRENLADLLSEYENILLVSGLLDAHIPYTDVLTQITLIRNRKNGHILENVAHMSMFEAKDELKKILMSFINSI